MKSFLVILFLLSSLHAATITIVSTVNCPYTCADDAADKGFLVDMVSYVFEKSGYDVVYTTLASHKEALAAVKEGKFNLMIGADSKKDKGLIYMKKPLGYTYNVIAVPKYSKWKYTSVKSFDKLRLAAIQELDYDQEIGEYIRKYKYDSAKVQMKSGHLARKQNLKGLRFEKVDALIDDRVALRYFYFKIKKPFAFKIAHTAQSNPIEIAFSPRTYRSKKYKELLYKGLRRLERSQTLKEIMQVYGLSEAYIRPFSSAH